MDPINYMLDVQSPMQMALGGYNTAIDQARARQGMQFANTQEERAASQEARAAEAFAIEKRAAEESRAAAAAERQAAIAAKERGDAAMMRLIDLGQNATTKDYLIAIAQNPAYKESLGTVFETFGEERKSGEVQFGTKLFSSLKSNPDVAKSMIAERKAAAEAAGDKATVDTMKSFEMMLDQPGGADILAATVGTTLAGVMGGTEFKAVMEAIGVPDGKGDFDQEQKIRKEYVDRTKNFTETEQSYNRIVAAQPNGPGDISLIFSYMKMLDPASTINTGEYANAKNSGGVPDAVRNIYNSAMNGELLSEEQRTAFKSQASSILEAARQTEIKVREDLMPVIEEYNLDPQRVFGTVGVGQTSETGTDEGAGVVPPPSTTPAAIPQSFSSSQDVIDAAKNYGVTIEDIWGMMTPEQRAQYGG